MFYSWIRPHEGQEAVRGLMSDVPALACVRFAALRSMMQETKGDSHVCCLQDPASVSLGCESSTGGVVDRSEILS